MEKIGEGHSAKVYLEDKKAIKVYSNMPYHAVCMEAKAQEVAYSAGLSAPKVYGVEQVGSEVRLIMEYIPGDIIVWPKMDKNDRRKAFEDMVILQKEIHSIPAHGLDKFHDRLLLQLEKASVFLEESRIASLKRQLFSLDDGKESLCHGDLHPGNVIRSGLNLVTIDWLDATSGNPIADICRSYVVIRRYYARMASTYLKMCCTIMGYAEEEVLQWLPIIAACSLNERLSQKHKELLMSLIK